MVKVYKPERGVVTTSKKKPKTKRAGRVGRAGLGAALRGGGRAFMKGGKV